MRLLPAIYSLCCIGHSSREAKIVILNVLQPAHRVATTTVRRLAYSFSTFLPAIGFSKTLLHCLVLSSIVFVSDLSRKSVLFQKPRYWTTCGKIWRPVHWQIDVGQEAMQTPPVCIFDDNETCDCLNVSRPPRCPARWVGWPWNLLVVSWYLGISWYLQCTVWGRFLNLETVNTTCRHGVTLGHYSGIPMEGRWKISIAHETPTRTWLPERSRYRCISGSREDQGKTSLIQSGNLRREKKYLPFWFSAIASPSVWGYIYGNYWRVKQGSWFMIQKLSTV